MTRATTRRRTLRNNGLAALGLTVCFFVAGCGEEKEDVSPSYEDRIPVGVTLTAGDREIKWQERVLLRGALTQGDEQLSDQEVRIEADPYPFDERWQSAATATTDDSGRFAIRARPDANTQYRALAGDGGQAESKLARVFVAPLEKLRSEPAESGGTRFELELSHPDDRALQGSSVYNYVASTATAESTGELPFGGVTQVSQEKPGLSVASITVPEAPGGVEYDFCVSFTADSGMGAPGAPCTEGPVPFRGG